MNVVYVHIKDALCPSIHFKKVKYSLCSGRESILPSVLCSPLAETCIVVESLYRLADVCLRGGSVTEWRAMIPPVKVDSLFLLITLVLCILNSCVVRYMQV